MKKKDLYIPVNVPDRNEFVPGFGNQELVACGVALALGIVTFVIMKYGFGCGMVKSLIGCISFLAIAIVIFKKDKFGENLVYKLQYVIRFFQSQKRYVYKQYNIYEGEVKRNGKTADKHTGANRESIC